MASGLPSIVSNTTAPAALVGDAGSNFWLFSPSVGWDLTHPPSPDGPPQPPARRLTLSTTTAPVTVDPGKTALIVIDMQNFFLSPAMGRARGPGHAAGEVLLSTGFPAAREAGIRVVHVTWGISDEELAVLPPVIFRIFGYEQTPAEEEDGRLTEKKDNTRHVGRDLGTVKYPDGTTVGAGRALMRDQWNTALYGGLQESFDDSQGTAMPQVRFHKSRLSGFWSGGSNDLIGYLKEHKITTLLFAGVNTDQCVLASIQDACNLGFDTILLKDGCGTRSPDYTRQMVEFNARKAWGFVSSCKGLADGVKATRQTPSL
ncbi:Isochorismatase-like protein [Diplogelasinospora grovesii]|uniref:Isochorismatase-like protein n=1 Tax=Diplogelasinospora grovesii TaxID=303347 RepID=A0AAN6MXF0_9PEZI|nr:Isochorismatase-like protein [Diplogelasinospora grovesii]